MTAVEGLPSGPDVDFDHHSPVYAKDKERLEQNFRAECPVFRTPSHGGFWVVSTYDGLREALQDRGFCRSDKSDYDEGQTPVGGVTIPPFNSRQIPNECDPPIWDLYRKVVSRAFAPRAVDALRPATEGLATEVINSVIESGRADFVNQVAGPVTALTTLNMLGLPLEDWAFYADPIHAFASGGAVEGNWIFDTLYPHLRETISARRRSPQTGLLDELIAARPDGRALTDQEVVELMWQFLSGGMETTTNLLAWSMWYLDGRRDLHQQLVEDDSYLRIATEEFVRWSSPVNAMARTAGHDRELLGQQIRAGDRILLLHGSANRDESKFENPTEVDLTRFPNPHFGFGTGIHRCLGSNLARQVFQVACRQSLERFVDFRVVRESSRQISDISIANGWVQMDIEFTPGQRLASGYERFAPVLGN